MPIRFEVKSIIAISNIGAIKSVPEIVNMDSLPSAVTEIKPAGAVGR